MKKHPGHKNRKRPVIPLNDTHPGPGLKVLNGQVEEVDARVMLGEGGDKK